MRPSAAPDLSSFAFSKAIPAIDWSREEERRPMQRGVRHLAHPPSSSSASSVSSKNKERERERDDMRRDQRDVASCEYIAEMRVERETKRTIKVSRLLQL